MAMDHTCGKLEGFDFRLKTMESLTRKIHADSIQKRVPLEQAAKEIGDSLRYTMTYETKDYVKGAEDLLTRLEAQGHTVLKFKNTWGKNEKGMTNIYQGININMQAPNGTKWEMQIHTPESFRTKEVLNHRMYEEWRAINPPPDTARSVALEKAMSDNQSKVPVPPGVDGFKWVKKK